MYLFTVLCPSPEVVLAIHDCLDKVGNEALHSGIDHVYASKAMSNVYACDGKVDVHARH